MTQGSRSAGLSSDEVNSAEAKKLVGVPPDQSETGDGGQLERFLSDASSPGDDEQLLSRRQLLRGGMAGGAAGLAVAAGVGAAVWKVADAQMQAGMAEAEAEIARLQGLVDLYENLEKVGLDAVLETGMMAVALPLEGIERGAGILKKGLELLEEALVSLEEALPSAVEALRWLEDQVSALATGIQELEVALGSALDKAADHPVAEALGELANVILDNLPFGLGDKIRGVLDGVIQLVTGIDDLLEGVNTQLLHPLGEKWFSSETGQGVGMTLINPLVEKILDPLEGHLSEVAVLTDAWQQKLMAPAQQAVRDRAEIREQIAGYRLEHGFD